MKPWKLLTLLFGLCVLIFGSYYERLPDWDIGISLIMGLLTFFTAPLCIEWIIKRDYKKLPLGLFLAWFSIDGSYWLYNAALNHEYFRAANWPASTPLYFMMGLFWYVDWPLVIQQARRKAA